MTDSGNAGKEMDLDLALTHVSGDREFLAELAAMFLEDYAEKRDELRRAVEQGQYAEFERAAHTLKGRLAFFGFRRARDRALELEAMGRERNAANAPRVLSEIESLMDGVLLELESLVRECGR